MEKLLRAGQDEETQTPIKQEWEREKLVGKYIV